jgi:hypothetical protein
VAFYDEIEALVGEVRPHRGSRRPSGLIVDEQAARAAITEVTGNTAPGRRYAGDVHPAGNWSAVAESPQRPAH